MNYTIMADPIRGWQYDHEGKKVNEHHKRKSGMTRVNKYRKMLNYEKINFWEIFIPAGVKHFPEELKELHQKFTEYHPVQDLYVFLLP